MTHAHTPHPRIAERKKVGAHLRSDEHVGFNGRLALLVTNLVGTIWCAYLFAVTALISLPSAIQAGTASLVSWIAQTFLQLVLLSVIMVEQKVAARASDKEALQTFEYTEALLKLQDEVHKLIVINHQLTRETQSCFRAHGARWRKSDQIITSAPLLIRISGPRTIFPQHTNRQF